MRSKENIRIHLENAFKLYSQKPNGDYRNSIKESISAVEALCRSLTGEDTLGASLKKLEDSGVYMQRFLKDSFTKLYVYTNDKETGIRHALMDAENIPDKEDAYYMLITCSAFINYINQKIAAKNKAE